MSGTYNLTKSVFVSTDADADAKFRVADTAGRDALITNQLIKVGHIIFLEAANQHYKLKNYPTKGSLFGVVWEGIGLVLDGVTSTSTSAALSATQGKQLKEMIEDRVPSSEPTALTDGSTVDVDCQSSDNQQFTLSSSFTSCTIDLSNLENGATVKVIITPQSAADHNYTFTHTTLTCRVADQAGNTLTLNTADDYILFASRAGSKIHISFDSRPY